MAADPVLKAALMMCKVKKMFFALIPKGPADGTLIVKKVKVPVKEIVAAQAELGVKNKPITGRCIGPITEMVFLTAKPAPGSMKAALKVIGKRDIGTPIIADLQLDVKADEDEEEEDTGEEVNVAVVSPRDAAAAAGAVAGAAAGAPEGDAAGAAARPPQAPPRPPLNLSRWLAARQQAITHLKGLAAKVAGTKHGDAAGVVKEISALINKLPANPEPHTIDALQAFIQQDESITAAEQSPKHFADVNIRAPMLEALEAIQQEALIA